MTIEEMLGVLVLSWSMKKGEKQLDRIYEYCKERTRYAFAKVKGVLSHVQLRA